MPLQRISVKNNDIENWIMTSSTEPVYNKQGNNGDGGNSRFGSTSSNISFSNNDICRICHCEADSANPLLAPCYCSGSLKYVHQACLQQWLTASETRSCELCKFNFIMHTKIKPFNEWRRLEMSYVERRRLCCAVLFHCVAALCVIWSLFVLIDRAAEEVQKGTIAWPFWTKLVVVAVGFTGGAVFMYIQCRQYLQLCNRWRAHNRILLIQNAPEKAVAPPSPNFRVSVRPSAANNTAISNAQVVANIENNPLQQNNLDTNTQQHETGFPVAVISNVSENNSLKSQQSIVSSNSNNRNNAPLNLSSSYIFGERNLTTAAQPSTSKNPIENASAFKERNSSIRSDNSIQLKPMEISNNGELKSSDMISQTCLPANFRNALKNQRRTSQHDAFFRLETPNFDPLEINMQETLASDIESRLNRTRTGKNSVISLANVTTTDRDINFEKNRSVFKSLPNLTASTERLLP